jgi:hypothetical protein
MSDGLFCISVMSSFNPRIFPCNQYRCFWYQVMTSMEDETAQLKGACDVAYCPGDLLTMPSSIKKISQLMIKSGEMLEGLPCRITTFQFCYNDNRVRYILSKMGVAFGKSVRLRIRTHFGTFLIISCSVFHLFTRF